MKDKINQPKSPSDVPLNEGWELDYASPDLTVEEAQELMNDFLAKICRKPAVARMLLKNEIDQKWWNPTWQEVEDVIRELDPGHFNSFACLSVPGNSYVQCLRGFNGWHLEWRVTKPSGDYDHYRACYPGGSRKPYELKKHDRVSDGQHRDLLQLDEVLTAFRSFHQDRGLPGSLKWRKFDI